MKLFRTDLFELPLPPEHRFPLRKYGELTRWVAESGQCQGELLVPPAASDAQLLLVHTPEYVHKVAAGELTPLEIRRIGFPWSPQLVERSRRSVGGTVAAALSSLADGFAANLAGGTHHAFADSGQGYCVFNDVAVAARVLQQEGRAERIAIVDCDVHQGNGTAEIFRHDSSVYTFSMHGARNFPFRKCEGDLDLALPDGTEDSEYLTALAHGLERVFAESAAQAVLYIAGADPYCGDRLGRLALTTAGLAARDRMVFEECARRNLPVTMTLGGGYAAAVEEIVAIHSQSLLIAQDVFGR